MTTTRGITLVATDVFSVQAYSVPSPAELVPGVATYPVPVVVPGEVPYEVPQQLRVHQAMGRLREIGDSL